MNEYCAAYFFVHCLHATGKRQCVRLYSSTENVGGGVGK